MVVGNRPNERLVFVVARAPQDGRAIDRALGEAGIESRLCKVEALVPCVCAGAGAIIIEEEAVSEAGLQGFLAMLESQPPWSDIPVVVLTTTKREARAHWRKIQSRMSIHTTAVLERPMSVAVLLQIVESGLRSRAQQFRLRDQSLERDLLLTSVERSERRLSAVLNNTRMAVFFMDENQHCTFMNAAAEDLTGYSLAEVQGRSLHDALHHTHPDGSPYALQDCPIDRAFPESSQTEGEEVFVHKDGHFYPVAFTASPIRRDSSVVGTVLEVQDITQRQADTERLHMLLNELNHRVKNTLATVQSIFLQTLRGEPLSEHARNSVMARLNALSRSHDLLTERKWVSAPMRDVALRTLAPFGAADEGRGRFQLIGDAYLLTPKTALALAMGLHELATNAVKYGALSAEGGKVTLAWEELPDEVLQLQWIERDGPPVSVPTRRGFGLRLIEQGLTHELAGEVRLDFASAGLICKIDIPIHTALVPG